MLPETLGRKLPDNIDDIELSGSQGSLETEANAEELVRLDSEPKSTSVWQSAKQKSNIYNLYRKNNKIP